MTAETSDETSPGRTCWDFGRRSDGMRVIESSFAVFCAGQRADRYRKRRRTGEDGTRSDDGREVRVFVGTTSRAEFQRLYQTVH